MASDFLQAVVQIPRPPITSFMRDIKHRILRSALGATQISICYTFTVWFPSSYFDGDSEFPLPWPCFLIEIWKSIIYRRHAQSVWRRVQKVVLDLNSLHLVRIFYQLHLVVRKTPAATEPRFMEKRPEGPKDRKAMA